MGTYPFYHGMSHDCVMVIIILSCLEGIAR